MTQEETVKLLEILKAAYPNWKIDNPKQTLEVYEMALGSYKAEDIYKSARVHITRSKFPPSIAELIHGITRGHLVYDDSPTVNPKYKNLLPNGEYKDAIIKSEVKEVCDGSCICPYYGPHCKGTPEEQARCIL